MPRFAKSLILACMAGPSSVVWASRADVLPMPLARVPNIGLSDGPYGAVKLDFPTPRRTQQYRMLMLPKAPVFHAYSPYPDGIRPGKEVGPQVTFNVKFPVDFLEALPPAVLARLATLQVSPQQVDIFCVVQDQPWAAGVPMLLRPHAWAAPDVPETGNLNLPFEIQAGVFEAPETIRFVGHAPDAWLSTGISVHGPDGRAGTLVSSPNNLMVHGLDPRVSSAFWTLTATGGRAAATLHVLLNDQDHMALQAMVSRIHTLRDWLLELDRPGSALRGTPMVDQLHRLFRPIVREATFGAGHVEVRGSGFQGATAVRVAGTPAEDFQVASDDHLVVVTKALPGSPLQITTPLGVSLPVPAFRVPPPMGEFPATLWQGEPGAQLFVKGAQDSRVQTVPCAPGDVFVGEAQVRTAGMSWGFAGLGLVFRGPGGEPLGGGGPYSRQRATETAAPGPVLLGVRGAAPQGAHSVTFVVHASGSAGATAMFDNLRFGKAGGLTEVKAPVGPASPALPPAQPATPLVAPSSLPPANQLVAPPPLPHATPLVAPPPFPSVPLPNLWHGGRVVRLHDQGVMETAPCVPGQTFQLSCTVDMTEMKLRGFALAKIEFETADGKGCAPAEVRPAQRGGAGTPTLEHLVFQSTAPAGAARVVFTLLPLVDEVTFRDMTCILVP